MKCELPKSSFWMRYWYAASSLWRILFGTEWRRRLTLGILTALLSASCHRLAKHHPVPVCDTVDKLLALLRLEP